MEVLRLYMKKGEKQLPLSFCTISWIIGSVGLEIKIQDHQLFLLFSHTAAA